MGQKIKKVQPKKIVKSNKSKKFFSWNCIFGNFPSSKIDFFGHFWNCKKWILFNKKFREIDLLDFTTFFALGFFNFLAYCADWENSRLKIRKIVQFREKSLHNFPSDMVCLKSLKKVYEFVFKSVKFSNFIFCILFSFLNLCAL